MSEQIPHESASALGRVDEVCRRFEAAWKAHLADAAGAPRPRLDDYAEALPEADRPLLERELRAVDAAYARRLTGEGGPPTAALTDKDGPGDDGVSRVPYFGDYELLEKIASGGFGVVYKARQVSLNRLVALKMIADGRLATPELVQRFRVEAEAAAGLEHEGIVPVYEVGAHDGQHYFSMKLIEGGSLTAHVGRYVKDRRAAAALMAQVARAVHHAHQRGVLHRDLKPGNILLDATGQPHVTDFGLAKLLEGRHAAGAERRPETVSGTVLGTPGYMAPEQARGLKRVTTAADVYGLGAVLYELLTGRPPFRADAPLDALVQVLEREPERPRSLDSRIDRDVETVCLKCLEKEPGRRYGTAEAVAEELERWLDGRPILARPAGQVERLWRWCRRNPAVAGLSAAVALSLVAGTVISVAFAVRAENQAELARKSESETAVALARAEEALAEGLLRPLGITRRGERVSVFEWQALADLALVPPEQARVRLLFIEQALGNERKAGQLGRRLEPALQAAVGTCAEVRWRVIDLAQGALRDESRPLSMRLVAARTLVELNGEEGDLTRQVASILPQGLTDGEGTAEVEALEAIGQVSGRSTTGAVAITRQVLELVPKADVTQLQTLSRVVDAVAEKGGPEATRTATAAVTRRALELLPKAEGGRLQVLSVVVAAEKGDPEVARAAAAAVAGRALELVPRAEAEQLRELSGVVDAVAEKGGPEATRAAAAAIARRALELLPRADAEQLGALAQAVEAVVEKRDPEAVRPVATAAARRTLELLPRADRSELYALMWGVAVAAKGDPEAVRPVAAAVARRALELLSETATLTYPGLLEVVGHLDREAATAITRQALELIPRADEVLLLQLSMVVAAVADKGDPEATRPVAAAVTRRTLELLSKTGEHYPELLPRSVAEVAGRLDREVATAVTGRAQEFVLQADADQLQALSGVVAAVAEKGDPEATRAAAAAVAGRALELLPRADARELYVLLKAVEAAAEKGPPGPPARPPRSPGAPSNSSTKTDVSAS
jgi:hypothetical protein